MNRPGFVIPLALLVTVFNAFGQVFIKKAVSSVSGDVSPLGTALRALGSGWLYLGLGVTALGTATWLVILARAELSYATPFAGAAVLVIVWFSTLFLHEPVTPLRIAGSLIIAAGIAMVARS